jgi:hypothetical protein
MQSLSKQYRNQSIYIAINKYYIHHAAAGNSKIIKTFLDNIASQRSHIQGFRLQS